MPDQFILFVEATALGLLLGIYYDIFRAIRACCRIRNLPLVFVTDSLFWFTATIYCMWFIFYYRWGEIYTFTYLGLAAGATVYFCCFSPCLFKFWFRVISVLVQAGTLIRRALWRASAIAVYPAGRLSAGVAGLKRIGNIPAVRRIFCHISRKKK